jgi:hypothetical protein
VFWHTAYPIQISYRVSNPSGSILASSAALLAVMLEAEELTMLGCSPELANAALGNNAAHARLAIARNATGNPRSFTTRASWCSPGSLIRFQFLAQAESTVKRLSVCNAGRVTSL